MCLTTAPIYPDDEGVNAILPATDCSGCDETRQFNVEMAEDYIQDESNGDIIHSGIIVAEVADVGKVLL